MRTEDDLRAALMTLETHAPEPAAVLAGLPAPGAARPVTGHRRRTRSVLVAAAAASVAAVATATALLPGVFRPGAQGGPAASAGSAASALRQLAIVAAAQPTRALGPVLYTKDALWVSASGSVANADLQREWVSAAARYFVTGKASGYAKFDPRNNPYWNWSNPATLPSDEGALRRHLLAGPAGPTGRAGGPPVSPDQAVFTRAVQLMTTEPLRPATRASMLRLIAAMAARSPREFVVLGAVTDRVGHRDIAIAGESNEAWRYSARRHAWTLVRTRSTELIVYYFDPGSGAIRAQEHATCRGPVHTTTAVNARCAVANYEQYFVAAAVRSLPKGASSASRLFAPYAFFPWPLVIR